MDIPISLSGNFMELRNDHFHSGLDMRTESKEGIPVKAAGDGWVSRIKVSPWGYGKALYIDHPNGYTTVYGHLRNYSGTIAGAALDGQYKAKAFEVDLTFSPGELAVKKGQVVANSGNTGGSGGPTCTLKCGEPTTSMRWIRSVLAWTFPTAFPELFWPANRPTGQQLPGTTVPR
ncbi:MAG: M23 family metallopeptidase [Flavobacteriales bacterium]|nr:M23 family metallopeptidase [Flavobacteriales bacterium]